MKGCGRLTGKHFRPQDYARNQQSENDKLKDIGGKTTNHGETPVHPSFVLLVCSHVKRCFSFVLSSELIAALLGDQSRSATSLAG
jgi:hypothetical protein